MIYFISSWYAGSRWLESEQIWHAGSLSTEFDDTVKQLQLFHRARLQPCCAIVLSHAPNLRHFLHRQSILNVPYWSLFDAVQCVARKKPAVFSFHDLAWPEGTEFVYTPQGVTALLQGVLFARVEFGHDGNPIEVELFKNGATSRRNYYDDRGFVSRTVLYRGGKPDYEQYLDEKGTWKIARYFSDGRVVINPKSAFYRLEFGGNVTRFAYRGEAYPSMEALIAEVLSAYVEQTGSEDIFCAAAHPLHARVLQLVLEGRKLILSFFTRRGYYLDNETIRTLGGQAAFLVADATEGRSLLLRTFQKEENRVIEISPFDTRQDSGTSQQQRVKKILIAADSLTEKTLRDSILSLADYAATDSDARIHLLTRKPGQESRRLLLKMARTVLEEAGRDPFLAGFPGPDGEEDPSSPRILADSCPDELSLSRLLRQVRIAADLSEKPDIFLQVSCVGIGIPQIALRESRYLVDGKNGAVITSPQQLPEVLKRYLGNLAAWNEASVFSHEMGRNYTSANQKKQWMEVVEALG